MKITLEVYSIDDLEVQVDFIKKDINRGLSFKELKEKYVNVKEKENSKQ